MIIVRETRIPNPDKLHRYNIYIPTTNGHFKYYNIYTCMCCKRVFIQPKNELDEPDTNITINDVPNNTIKHWYTQVKDIWHNNDIAKVLEKVIKKEKICKN